MSLRAPALPPRFATPKRIGSGGMGVVYEAIDVERGTMQDQRIMPLSEGPDVGSPYFSMVLIPGQGRRL